MGRNTKWAAVANKDTIYEHNIQTNLIEQQLLCIKLVLYEYMSQAEYSETLGLGLDQFYGLGLGLEAETQIISVSDSVSILRL